MSRRFHTLDVFTGRALAGNPLAVVLDAEGLDDARMQAIAREFNLSETVFVSPPASPDARAALRIFTPGRELPFAGHPTVGTAVLLALLDGRGAAGAERIVLEETVGPVACAVETFGEGLGRADFVLPRAPEWMADLPDTTAVAAALGLRADEIGFGDHRPCVHTAGVPYAFVPVKSRAAVTRAWPRGEAFESAFAGVQPGDAAAYVYCAEPLEAQSAFHARMFAPAFGMIEDPATGSAAAAFAGALMRAAPQADGETAFVIEQGDAMGRPSRITLTLEVEGGALRRARIGGEAVVVSEGRLLA